VIKLGVRHPRKKERKKERKKARIPTAIVCTQKATILFVAFSFFLSFSATARESFLGST